MSSLYEFTRDGRSALIHTPRTPRPWWNYLWNDLGYLMGVTHLGAGYSEYLTDEMDLNEITGGGTKHVYLRDEDSGACWCPAYGPLNEPLDDYTCEHNLAFSEMRASRDGVSSAFTLAVPTDGLFELWRLRLTNESDRTRTLSAFALTSWSLTGFPHPRYYGNYTLTTCFYADELNGVFAHSDHPYAPHDRYKAFLACSEPVEASDAFLPAFLGGAGSAARPEALLQGRDCTGSETVGTGNGAVLQNRITLEPDQTKELTYCLGICASREEATAICDRAFTPGALDSAIDDQTARWEGMIGRCDLRTPDEQVNDILNVWVKKEMVYCSRGKKGVRDNMQIDDGIVQIAPEGARAEMLEILSHQFQDGHTVLTWLPYDDTHYSDQPFWLVMGLAGYIKETGDRDILDEVVPYQDGGEGTVWEHLRAGLRLKQTDLGPNGLCRLRYADWNDALNVTTDEDAESVFVTVSVGYMLLEMAEMAERRGEEEFAAECREDHAELAELVNDVAWDGEWYARAFHKDGVIGGKESKGSIIYANPQIWAIIGELVPEDRLPIVLDSMDRLLEHEFGLLVNAPPYEEFDPSVGRISAQPPGVSENGVWCHVSGFGAVANAKVGRGEVAFRLLRKVMPDSEWNPVSRSGAAPYVFASGYRTSPHLYGWVVKPWMTGTSVWCFKALLEWILGVRRGYDGLILDPCLPSDWEQTRVKRTYRGATYDITIRNPHGLQKGRPAVTVDGGSIEGNVLPVFADGRTHAVTVTLEKQ